MRISIITVCYNAEAYITDAIQSVLGQQGITLEYIIVDGASKDNTQSIINTFKDSRIKFISEPDTGIYDAMNKGISIATGDIIGILNADDIYAHNQVLAEVLQGFTTHNTNTLYADLKYVQAENTNKTVRYWKAKMYKPGSFLTGWMPPHPTFFVKKMVYNSLGMFDLRLKSAADYELMLRFLHKNKVSTAYLPRTIVKMRTGGNSNANFKARKNALKEDALAWKLNGLKPKYYTLLLKKLRKLPQYLFKN